MIKELKPYLKALADTFRNTLGTTEKINAQDFPSKVNEVYEKGKAEGGGGKSFYDEFWDNYQDYGNRTTYSYAFAGDGWIDTGLLPPKYPIVLSASSTTNLGIFKQFNADGGDNKTVYDMTEICKLLDASNGKVLTEMFMDAWVKNITLDLSNCTTATNMFHCGIRGGKINYVYLKVTEKLVSASNMFSQCKYLTTIIFTDDSVIAVSLSFAQSDKLTDESVDSIVNALKDLTGATSKTLTVHETVYNRMVELGKDALVTAKNWILAKA